MANIVSFTKARNRARGHALDGFVDDGELLEFSAPKNAQTQANDSAQHRPAHQKSILASYWTNQELADLYRAYSLIQSAQPDLECDRGVSDEGDPWFLIGDHVGDVLVHICRIEGIYILDSVALSTVLKGTSFNALIEGFLSSVVGDRTQDAKSPVFSDDPVNVVRLARGGTVCLHPSMMIAALVWTLLMNADGLTLPSSNGILGRKGLDQGQGKDQDSAASINDAFPDGYDSAGFQVDLAKSEKIDISAGEFSNDLSITRMNAKEEKHLQIPAFSHALTTMAIAAGFYTSAEAANALWKFSTKMNTDTLDSLDRIEPSDGSGLTTSADHLSDALALLNRAVDLVGFESLENFLAEHRNAEDESTATLTSAEMDIIEVLKEGSVGQQMLATSNDLSKAIAKAAQTKAPDISDKEFIEAEKTLQTDKAVNSSGKVSALNSQEQTSDSSPSTNAFIQDIMEDYASHVINLSLYDTLSFQPGVGQFNDELQKYAEIIDQVPFPVEEDSPIYFESEDTVLGSASFRPLDDAARKLIGSKLPNYDVEIFVFTNKTIIVLDMDASSENNTTVSWQHEDGSMISMIGQPSDMAEFLVA